MSETQKERMYQFQRRRSADPKDVETLIIAESELEHDHTAMLVQELWQAYNYMPDIVQDIFIAQLADKMENNRISAENAKGKIITMETDNQGIIAPPSSRGRGRTLANWDALHPGNKIPGGEQGMKGTEGPGGGPKGAPGMTGVPHLNENGEA